LLQPVLLALYLIVTLLGRIFHFYCIQPVLLQLMVNALVSLRLITAVVIYTTHQYNYFE